MSQISTDKIYYIFQNKQFHNLVVFSLNHLKVTINIKSLYCFSVHRYWQIWIIVKYSIFFFKFYKYPTTSKCSKNSELFIVFLFIFRFVLTKILIKFFSTNCFYYKKSKVFISFKPNKQFVHVRIKGSKNSDTEFQLGNTNFEYNI